MKKIGLTILLLAFVAAPGCVCMSAEYSRLLNETAILSDHTATMAENGQISEDQKTAALRKQATTWKKFQNARDCKN